MPVQWCSTRKTPINPTRNGPSWHLAGELGRPTGFIDGHAEALTSPDYIGYSGAIRESNRDVHMLSNEGTDYWVQAGDFALSEY